MLNTITFQVGTDIIGQPLFHTHYISEKEYNGGVYVVVKSLTHR